MCGPDTKPCAEYRIINFLQGISLVSITAAAYRFAKKYLRIIVAGKGGWG